MRRQTFLATFLFLLLSSTAWSQQLSARITNQDVIDMVGLGLSDDVIVAKIRGASAGGTLQFDTSVKGLKELKAAKVSDEVIKVMINPAPPAGPVVVAAAPMSNDPNLPAPRGGRLLEKRLCVRPHRGTGHQPGEGGRQGRQHVHLWPAKRTLGCLSRRSAI